jgi:hypothetical protein
VAATPPISIYDGVADDVAHVVGVDVSFTGGVGVVADDVYVTVDVDVTDAITDSVTNAVIDDYNGAVTHWRCH